MFTYKVEQLDGDNVRELFQNKDYSEKGRRYNVDIVQKISHYIQTKGDDAIVSLVSPYRDQREEFKNLMGDKMSGNLQYIPRRKKRPSNPKTIKNL